MLSKETKKKIDDARDILVGQLPLPSDQVELITIALIYKFMDDQDEDLRQLGFEEAFFSADLMPYSWQRLMSNEIDAEERVNKFTKGIEEIQKAAHIPQQLGVGIEGYDITPLMTRLARVNLYLHQFKSPRIHEYDTLTSDGRWKEKYDCILANPPFMTPKGGVSTHSKFRIRASKAEVLFSDYILECLSNRAASSFAWMLIRPRQPGSA